MSIILSQDYSSVAVINCVKIKIGSICRQTSLLGQPGLIEINLFPNMISSRRNKLICGIRTVLAQYFKTFCTATNGVENMEKG